MIFGNRNILDEIAPLPGPIVQPLIEAHYFYHNNTFVTDVFPVLNRVNR